MNGVQEAADTLEALDPMPRFLLPLRNAEIDASGGLRWVFVLQDATCCDMFCEDLQLRFPWKKLLKTCCLVSFFYQVS